MGLLDAPPATSAKVGAHVTQMLANNQQSVQLCVVGDSTGVPVGGGGDNRWVYIVAQYLAAAFPAYKVDHRLWNDTNQNFDAATTIQAGTGTGNSGGPFVLTVWNASKSGAAGSYWSPKASTILTAAAVVMDLILVNLGHNESGQGTGMRSRMIPVLQALRAYLPGQAVALVTQNPQNGAGSSSSATEEANQLMRMTELRKLSAEGWGLIDVMPAFQANASYKSALILADGIHPNSAGSAVWAAEVERHFPVTRDRFTPPWRGQTGITDHIWVPFSAFYPVEGSPVMAVANSFFPAWSMPAAADSMVAAYVDIPNDWRTVNSYALFTQSVASAANFVSRLRTRNASANQRIDAASGTTLSSSVSNFNTKIQAASASQYGITAVNTANSTAVTNSGFVARPMMMAIERLGTNVSDVQANAMLFYGLALVRET